MPNVSRVWMDRVAEATDLGADLIKGQQRRSDYDSLYFGLQDMMDILIGGSYRDVMYPRRSTRRRSTRRSKPRRSTRRSKPRTLSKWQKYIKNKRNHIKLRNGKLNLKKMAVQYRKKNK